MFPAYAESLEEFLVVKTFSLFLLILCTAFFACNEEVPTRVEEQVPRITLIQAPDQAYQTPAPPIGIHVRVEDDQGVGDIAGVRLIVNTNAGVQVASHEMRDDGQGGDILKEDGQYFLPINATLTSNQTGTFVLEATARDKSNNTSATQRDTLTILAGDENGLPSVISAEAPPQIVTDSVYTPQLLATVSDPEGVQTIQYVLLEIYPPAFNKPTHTDTLRDDGQSGDGASDDGVFGLQISPAVLGTKCGVFTFSFRAVDASGGASVAVLRYTRVGVINAPPQISDLSAPTTISRSATPNTYVLSIRAVDPNGTCDDGIARVFFNSFLPNGNAATGNPFAMRDDGKEGDSTANDGRYSLTIQINAQAATGTYRFEFQAQDRSGALSEKIIHLLNVTP